MGTILNTCAPCFFGEERVPAMGAILNTCTPSPFEEGGGLGWGQGYRLLRINRCCSRCHSRSRSTSLLSCCFFPFASPISSLIFPRFK
jgi:hypothetical protein